MLIGLFWNPVTLFHLSPFRYHRVQYDEVDVWVSSKQRLLRTVQFKTIYLLIVTRLVQLLFLLFIASNCQLFPPGSKMAISPIHDEARQLRAQISLAMTVSAVLPLLQRLLEMSCYLTNLIRESTEADFRCHSIESFEYVWNTTKIAVVRWEDLKGLTNQDTSLNAVRYAYGTLPLFSNWEKLDHLEMLGNVILLIINTVKNSQSLSPNSESPLNCSILNFSYGSLPKNIIQAKNKLKIF